MRAKAPHEAGGISGAIDLVFLRLRIRLSKTLARNGLTRPACLTYTVTMVLQQTFAYFFSYPGGGRPIT
jgi:hypothetical protein